MLVIVVIEELVDNFNVAVVVLRPEISKHKRIIESAVPKTEVVHYSNLARSLNLFSVHMQYHLAAT